MLNVMRRVIVFLLSLLFLFSLGLNVYFLHTRNTQTHTPLPSPTPSLPGEIQTIKTVVDGDTVIAASGVRMRLANIEAPELAYCGGKEAKQRLTDLVQGKSVRVVMTQEDVYNRSLVFLSVKGTLVNEALISEGLVRYDGSPSSERDRIRSAYEQAVQQKRGIYGPPCHSEQPDRPGCTIKGNISRAEQEKVYYLPFCTEYVRVVVEKDLGEQWFCTEKEAQSAGYTKATSCN